MYKKKFIIYLFLVITINACNKGKKSDNLSKKSTEIEVDVHIVSPKLMKHQIEINGSILSNEEIELRPEVSGRIKNILFKEGEVVNKGQLLIKLIDDELQSQLQKNELQIQLASKEEFRKKELLSIKGISEMEYDEIVHQLNSFKSERAIIQAMISKTEIFAPFSGIIGIRNVSEGAFVTNTTKIATLQQNNPVKIEFSIPERYVSIIKKGKKITFSTASSEKEFIANIYAFEPKIDLTTRSVKIRAMADNSYNLLFPGSFAKINFDLTKENKSIVLPTKAIIPILNGEQVFIIKNGKAVAKRVKSGLRTKDEIEIIEGLNPTDTVVLSGLIQMKEGTSLRAKQQ